MTLNTRNPTDGKSGDNLAKAAKKKRSNNETMDEAWARIFDMKNSASDERRLREVNEAMEKGIIGSESGKAGKSFTKAEALRQHRKLVDIQREDTLRELVEETPDNYLLVRSIQALNSMIMYIEDRELIAIDVDS